MPPIYLDYNATTPIAREVADAMTPYLYEHFGNPSSPYAYGVTMKQAIETARPQATGDRRHWRLHGTLFTTGLLGIGYETLGVRAMAQVLENTVYRFAAVLAVYLFGTAIGASLYQRFCAAGDFRPRLSRLLCGLSLACAVGTWSLSEAKWTYDGSRAAFGDSLPGVLLAVREVGKRREFIVGLESILGL